MILQVVLVVVMVVSRRGTAQSSAAQLTYRQLSARTVLFRVHASRRAVAAPHVVTAYVLLRHTCCAIHIPHTLPPGGAGAAVYATLSLTCRRLLQTVSEYVTLVSDTRLARHALRTRTATCTGTAPHQSAQSAYSRPIT